MTSRNENARSEIARSAGRIEQKTRHDSVTDPAARQLPPFGAELESRLQYSNPPSMVFVFCGRNAWTRARNPRVRIGDCLPLVWSGADPAGIRWPVEGCAAVIEVDHGPTVEQVRDLAAKLLLAGAAGVMGWWLHWSESRPVAWSPDGKARYLSADEINCALWPEEYARRQEVGRAA